MASVEEFVAEWATDSHAHTDVVAEINAEIAAHEMAITQLNATLVALGKPARRTT
jgi:uncharacterized coiled-coil protein SlyX